MATRNKLQKSAKFGADIDPKHTYASFKNYYLKKSTIANITTVRYFEVMSGKFYTENLALNNKFKNESNNNNGNNNNNDKNNNYYYYRIYNYKYYQLYSTITQSYGSVSSILTT
jgi:hypothetical protein